MKMIGDYCNSWNQPGCQQQEIMQPVKLLGSYPAALLISQDRVLVNE